MLGTQSTLRAWGRPSFSLSPITHHLSPFVLLGIVLFLAIPSGLFARQAADVPSLRAVMDSQVDPGQDFSRYATGQWQDRTVIPPDMANYGLIEEVSAQTSARLLDELNALADSSTLAPGSDEWKAVRLFQQGIDLDRREAQGIDPIAADLDRIAAIATLDDLYAYLRGAALETAAWGLYGITGDIDMADSSRYTAWYSGPFLGLPNRDYYWDDTVGSEEIRDAYRVMNARLLSFIGYDDAAATNAAQRAYDFEKRLAEPLLGPEDYTDPAIYYNPRPVADLIAANPDFDWPAYLARLGIPDQETIVVPELAYLDAVDDIVTTTHLETIKDYLRLQVLWNTAFGLTGELEETLFDFYGRVLEGSEEQLPVEDRVLQTVQDYLGFALGKLYVAEHFSPEAKARIEAMVQQLLAATRTRIDTLAWMSEETKAEALRKLETMQVKVGYPNVWPTYDEVTIGESYIASVLDANIAAYRRAIERIGQPVDRDEWPLLPQDVNAYYLPTLNEIVFPAAILQAPYFSPAADPAYNYGAIGAAIGHEITHAYDQSGSQFDAAGNYVDWWTNRDARRFDALTEQVVAQYDAIEVLPGLFVDGGLTIGENIADMGGLQIAYDALQAELSTSGDPGLIEDLTQEQRFFIAYAYSWADKARDEYLETSVRTDWHAPPAVRAVQPARNMDAFFAAFGISRDDPMWLAPEERIIIW